MLSGAANTVKYSLIYQSEDIRDRVDENSPCFELTADFDEKVADEEFPCEKIP